MSSALTNPYAPPGPDSLAAPASALPPGFRRFRLDPAGFRSFATRRYLKRFAFVAPLFLFMLPAYGAGLPRVNFMISLTFILVASIIAARIVSVRRGTPAELATYELLVTPRVLRRTFAGAFPAEILRPEVTRIVETNAGLWIFCKVHRRSLFVARMVDGYADVRAELAAWRAIEPLSGPWVWWSTWRLLAEGQRDAVYGTSLADDPSLREELEAARRVSSAAHRVHPAAPLRWLTRPVGVLVYWGLLMGMLFAIWKFLSPAPPRSAAPHPRVHPASAE
jgi:hypothetical protein